MHHEEWWEQKRGHLDQKADGPTQRRKSWQASQTGVGMSKGTQVWTGIMRSAASAAHLSNSSGPVGEAHWTLHVHDSR